MQEKKTNQEDFEAIYNEYVEMCKKYNVNIIFSTAKKKDAQYFFNAGVASTKPKEKQIPALFKPKD